MKEEAYRRILRMVSVVVVLNLAFGGFLGLMLMSENAKAPVSLPPIVNGVITIDTSITIDGSTLPNGTLDIDASMLVTGGSGILTVKDTVLVFQSDTEHRYWLDVELGGTLILENSTITVQTNDLFDNYETIYWFNYSANGFTPTKETKFTRLIPFDMTITGDSVLRMSDDSALKFEGNLIIDNSRVDISDSTITSPNAPFSTHDWGVVVQISNCPSARRVVFADTRVEKSPWYQGISWYDEDTGGPAIQMYANHSITNSYAYFINTYFDVDYLNKTVPDMYEFQTDNHFPPDVNPNHNAINIDSSSTVKFYGLTIDMEETNNQIPNHGSTGIEVKDPTSNVALYRWLIVFPVDNKSVPVENAQVDVTTIFTGDATINGLNNLNNNQPVETYIESISDCQLTQVGDTVRAVTGTSGRGIFALVSDKLTDTGWPNSDQMDGYNINASVTSPATYYSDGLVQFENFPRVYPADNYVNYVMTPFDFEAPHAELRAEFDPVPPTSVLDGVMVDISVRVYNDIVVPPGKDADNIKIQFWDGDPNINTSTKIGEESIGTLTAGSNTLVTMSPSWFATPPGAHKIYVGVDRDFEKPLQNNQIPELNENDNVIFTPITVLDRPDLMVNGSKIYFTSGGDVVKLVVNGTAVTIVAPIYNIGGSQAANVEVEFYDGTPAGPGAYIGSDFVTVPAGGVVSASVGWGPYVGTHTVWVFVEIILEKDSTNNNATAVLDVNSRPDLDPSFATPGGPVEEGDTVTISASIINTGGWNVTENVKVRFYYMYLDNPDYMVSEVIITKDPFTGIAIEWNGGSREVSFEWVALYPPSQHTFYVRVDPDNTIIESLENNNVDSVVYDVNPRPNLRITEVDIDLSDAYPMNGASVSIDITIWNTGLSNVVDTFYVQVWLDEIGGSGTFLTEIEVSSGVTSGGGSVTENYVWSPATPIGSHEIVVHVDYNNTIAETNESDNQASTTIIIYEVPSDLIVNDANYGTLVLEGFSGADENDTYPMNGFCLVEESGELILRETTFKFVGQLMDDNFNIVVKDSGILRVEKDSLITTEQYHVFIYLYDDAQLFIDASIIGADVDIVAMGNSEITITDGSIIYGDIFANEIGSTVDITIINSSLTNNLFNIGGNTFVQLWGVNIGGQPADEYTVAVTDNGEVYIDWFLTVMTVDINDEPIVDVDVSWYRSPPWDVSGSQVTGSDGTAMFRLRGMNITSDGVEKGIRSNIVKASFTSTYTTLTYYPDSNITVEMTRNKMKTIKFSNVMPDLDPPLFVTYSGSTISVGDTATIISWVNNTGSNYAYDIYVKFDDNTTESGWPIWKHADFIAPGGSWYIEFEWMPKLIGWHNISIYIDPNDIIIEGDETNNMNWLDIYVTPQKADLVITNVMYTVVNNQYGPTENDTLSIHATISNIGETNAFPSPELPVAYYLDSIAPGNLLGYDNISGVAAGQTAGSAFLWDTTSPAGWYTIWIVVDPPPGGPGLVEETNEDNNTASILIYIKEYPDVTPVGIAFLVNDLPVTSVSDTTLVTIEATVENEGETNAVNVVVEFFDGNPDIGADLIGSKEIPLIIATVGTQVVSVVWEATVVGKSQVHNIYVVVSIIGENKVDNNNYTRDITVTLRPDLTVIGIDFSDNSPKEGDPFTIFALVQNIGGTDSAQFRVEFYDGDPDVDGVQIGSDTMSLTIDEIGTASVNWLSPVKGAHDIFVVADSQSVINEAIEANNVASEVIVVYSPARDLIVNNANTPYIIGSEGTPAPTTYQLRGYTLVEENGTLIITYATFRVLEEFDYQYNIIVRNRGTVIINSNSVILTNGPLLRIFLYDNSSLYVNDSLIDSTVVDIRAFGNPKIYLRESSINSYIKATGANANIMLSATNCTLSQPFRYFGGNSMGTFTNVFTPNVLISDNAELKVFRWLKVYVKDGAGTGIEGAEVNVSAYGGAMIPGSPRDTNFEGLALFDVHTDTFTADDNSSSVTFFVSGEYIYEERTYSGETSVGFTSYFDDKTKNIEEVDIVLINLLPDFRVDPTSVKFYVKGVERFTAGVGEEVTVEGTVTNVGNATTTSLTAVLVNFYHEIDGTLVLIGQDTIETEMTANGGQGVASIVWIPQESDHGDGRQIQIQVDPNNDIPEVIESLDNWAFANLNIIRPPDLQVTDIQFDTPSFKDTDNTTESETVTITATITNIGLDNTAIGVNVTFYDGFPDFDGDMLPDSPLPSSATLLGTVSLASLIPLQSQEASITWDTTGQRGGHSIYVYVTDAQGEPYISDQILSNNNMTRTFSVKPKPDLSPYLLPPRTTYIEFTRPDGTEITGDLEINQVVVLQTTIFNSGQVYLTGINVSFYDGDPEAGGVQIGGNVTISISPNNYRNASVQWLVSEPEGDRDIYVWVNRDESIIESDYTNNKVSDTFTISYAPVTVVFTLAIKSRYDLDKTVQVSAQATFTETGGGVPTQDYTIRIRRSSNDQQEGPEYTGTTDNAGVINREIPVPDTEGTYYVEIEVFYGPSPIITQSSDFRVQGEEVSFFEENLLLILIIIGIGVLVVVLVGVLLGRYGLGKLVECGECGAFIPEGEKKCPKCGAVFEADTAKCSECEAWIPVTSKSCPECGAIFAGIEKEKKGYVERMKGQYMEYVDQFREEAKEERGAGMSDEEFMDWWKTSPKYVGFEEWLSREEELRKGRTKSCPECNTVNPESAAICFKCGTVFKEEEEEEEYELPPAAPPAEVPPKAVPSAEAPAAAPPTVVPKKVARPPEVVPKKVVRQPPTVVPKKVVRPPEEGRPTVVPKKVVKRPPPEEEE
jgi:subtilase family serine protease